MSWAATLRAAVAATVDRPRWWLLALAGFLVRGGFLVFLLPIVILPTPAGLANAVAPALVGFVFGSPSESFVMLVAAATLALLLWLLLGGLAGASLEVALVRDAADIGDSRSLALRGLGVRLASHLPFAAALTWGAIRVVDAVYAELITPGDVAVPIVLRVVLRVPDVVVALIATWLAGEAAGGLAVRAAVLREGRGIRTSGWRALALGWHGLARPGALATLVVTTLLVLGVAAVVAASSSLAWLRVREALADQAPAAVVVATVASFTAVWLAGLGLVAAAVSVRSVAWTFEGWRLFGRGPDGRDRPPLIAHATGATEPGGAPRHGEPGQAV